MTVNKLNKNKEGNLAPLLAKDDDVEISEFIDQEIISKLDNLENNGNFYKKYSEIYLGGVYALNSKNRKDNPDWMSQSANSFREIIYLLTNNNKIELQKLLSDYLGKSFTKKETKKYKEYINNLYSFFSDLTHHFSNPDKEEYQINKNFKIGKNSLTKNTYFDAVRLYKEYLKLLIITAIDVHKKIDNCIKKYKNKKKTGKKLKELVKIFLNNSKV